MNFCISLVKHNKRDSKIVLNFMALKKVLAEELSAIETPRKDFLSV